MVVHKRPGIDRCACGFCELSHPADKRISVSIVADDTASRYTPDNNMVKRAWCIKSGTSGHDGMERVCKNGFYLKNNFFTTLLMLLHNVP